MKIVISIDSFKGSVTSIEAANAIKSGIKSVYSDAQVVIYPLADGGEGTIESLCSANSDRIVSKIVTGPLGEKINSFYGIMDNTAVIEIATAAGLPLVPTDKRNPLYTTTYGVGELICDAIEKGCRDFIIGIGGSATNDGGIGMLSALGFQFLDRNGNEVEFGANGLKRLSKIETNNVLAILSECTFNVACDVDNPLCGENGASKVYAKQKGADEQSIIDMDSWLFNYAQICKKTFQKVDEKLPGSGAAGGLGFAFRTFLNANIEAGATLILNKIGIEKDIADCDIVITGEGRLDGQSIHGKAPIGVAKIAKKYNKPVIAFSGCVTDDANLCNDFGIDAFFPVLRKIETLESAMMRENALKNISETTKQAFNLIKSVRNI